MPTMQISDQAHGSDRADAPEQRDIVHVTALYTQTARSAHFDAHLEETLELAIAEAYDKLQESPRSGDQVFTHNPPRLDLAPYRGSTLQALKDQEIGVHTDAHGKLVFAFDIDAETGGAAAGGAAA